MRDDFNKICEENYTRIFRYIYAMTKDSYISQDLVQEVFMIAYEKRKLVANHDNPSGFLYKTAKNLVYEKLRELKKYPKELNNDDFISKECDVFEVLEKQHDSRIDENKYVNHILDKLSNDKKILYSKYYIEHKTMKDIASLLFSFWILVFIDLSIAN